MVLPWEGPSSIPSFPAPSTPTRPVTPSPSLMSPTRRWVISAGPSQAVFEGPGPAHYSFFKKPDEKQKYSVQYTYDLLEVTEQRNGHSRESEVKA